MGLSAIDRSYERLVDRGRVGIRYRPGSTQPELWSAGEGPPPYKENDMGEQQPSVGRIVHFQEADDCLAAIIAGVNDDGSVNLSYFARTGGHRQIQNVPEAASDTVVERLARWHWPERV